MSYDSLAKAESDKSLRVYAAKPSYVFSCRAIRLLSKLIRAPDDAPEEEELSNFFRNKSWASRGAARARLLYTGPAISYGRRFRPITLTRLIRGIQSANARRGLRLRILLRRCARSRRTMRGESSARSAYVYTWRSACTIGVLLNLIHKIFITDSFIDLAFEFLSGKIGRVIEIPDIKSFQQVSRHSSRK